jgi:outer membrane protein assembly factor BamD (BamD/ComL family)
MAHFPTISYATRYLATLGIAFLTVSAAFGADLKQAQKLYDEGRYLESIDLIPQDSAAGIYLLYLNEKAVASRANPDSNNPREYGFLYNLYIKKNPALFETNEALGGSYEPTRYRYDQLLKLDPHSVYAGNIEYEWAVSFDNSVWEDGDGSMHTKELISDYEELIRKYPTAEFVAAVRKRIEELKVLHEMRTGEAIK